jgi:excisionase family DNA binding protein
MYHGASEYMAVHAEARWDYAASAMEAEWLTFDETADFLRISRPTMYRLINDHTLMPYEVRGLRGTRFKKKDLDGLFTPVAKKKPKSKPKRT